MSLIKVVVIGGGFAGLNVVQGLSRAADVDITLIDRTNHHLFQPLLYQVAGAALSPADIAVPLRWVVRQQENVHVVMETALKIDKENKLVHTADRSFGYDYLVIAAGSSHSYFGHDEWEAFAPGLKTIPDAIRIRETILAAFEHGEIAENPIEESKYLRFIIIGAGPTGVELAGAIAEIAYSNLFLNFRKITAEHAEILLVEGSDQVLPSFPKGLAAKAQKDLELLGVKVLTNTRVTDIKKEAVRIGDKWIEAGTIIWAAGNQASPLLRTLNVPLDKQGRVIVGEDLSIKDHPEIFVIGDATSAKNKEGKELPGIAPVAIQMGRYVAKIIKSHEGKRKPFTYVDKGMLATIGKRKAVGVVGKFKMSGFFAWLTWVAVHIFYLIGFRNRLLVMLQWFFLYVSGGRSVRLITRPKNKNE